MSRFPGPTSVWLACFLNLAIALAPANMLAVRLEGDPESQATLGATQQVEMPRAYTYSLFDINAASTTEGGNAASDVRPAGINRNGDIVGSADITIMGSVSRRGFVRTASSGGTRLADPAEGRIGAGNYATGINDAGEVVGYYAREERREHGYLWDGSAYVSFDVPGAAATFPSGINNRGQIAGYYRTEANHSKGFIKDGSSYTTIDIISGDVPHGTMIQGLNNVGQTVGFIVVSRGADSFASFAFVTDNGVFTLFNVPYTGSLQTIAYGINDSGLVTGTYFTGRVRRGFLRAPSGDFMEIDVPGALSTMPTGIRNDGTIVGYYWSGSIHCFTASPVW